MKRKISTFLLALLSAFMLTSCKEKDADLVATFYPHYDILSNIAQDNLKVSLIVPFGSEVHDFSPTPKDIKMINDSKLFVYASDELDVWVKDLIHNNIRYINMFENIDLEFEDDLGAIMHYWTDPNVFINMIDVLKDEIIDIDKENAHIYTENANKYKQTIKNLHNKLTSILENTNKEKILYFAGHDSLGGFSYRYNIEIKSLIDHFSPEAEQTIKQMTYIIDSLKETSTDYLFIEELTEPRIAKTIQRELKKHNQNIKVLELHSYHNITKDQGKRGVTYAELFEQNIKNIKQALN